MAIAVRLTCRHCGAELAIAVDPEKNPVLRGKPGEEVVVMKKGAPVAAKAKGLIEELEARVKELEASVKDAILSAVREAKGDAE